MADGALTIEIQEPLAERLASAAASKGVAVETFVRDALARHLDGDLGWNDDPDPAIDDAIAQAAERSGDVVPAKEVVAWMRSWFKPDELPMPVSPARR
jgi:predicted transcriptional regulator